MFKHLTNVYFLNSLQRVKPVPNDFVVLFLLVDSFLLPSLLFLVPFLNPQFIALWVPLWVLLLLSFLWLYMWNLPAEQLPLTTVLGFLMICHHLLRNDWRKNTEVVFFLVLNRLFLFFFLILALCLVGLFELFLQLSFNTSNIVNALLFDKFFK